MAIDIIDKTITELRKRLKELEPLREEAQRIEEALGNLTGGRVGRKRGPGRPPGRPKGSGRKPAAAKKRAAGAGTRRQRKGGTRREHALKAIQSQPGITVPEVAKKLGIKPNYVYRVAGELQKEGLIKKQGKGFAAK